MKRIRQEEIRKQNRKAAPSCQAVRKREQVGRFGELSELIGALLFLVDERASGFVTGVVLPVDGGYSAYSGV